jgi:hypothetical protein
MTCPGILPGADIPYLPYANSTNYFKTAFMRHRFYGSLLSTLILVLISCGSKDKKSPDPDPSIAKDTMVVDSAGDSKRAIVAGDTTLTASRPFIEKELAKWSKSFKGFHIDSFRYYQQTNFEDIDYEGATDLKEFYDLYKASLVYAPDSSHFIDLYSYGLMLERKGKKIIASSDVDNSVTLYDLKTKVWRRIAFSGPSSWVEEAVWTSPSTFILAGVGHNDDGETEAYLVLGNTKTKTFSWFESNAIRPHSSKYEASGMAKLKIDEWAE